MVLKIMGGGGIIIMYLKKKRDFLMTCANLPYALLIYSALGNYIAVVHNVVRNKIITNSG